MLLGGALAAGGGAATIFSVFAFALVAVAFALFAPAAVTVVLEAEGVAAAAAMDENDCGSLVVRNSSGMVTTRDEYWRSWPARSE